MLGPWYNLGLPMSADSSYTRLLFWIAALFNFIVAAGLLTVSGQVSAQLGLGPATAGSVVLSNLSGALVGVFGYAYARVAMDPQRYRVYVELGVVGKLLLLPAVGIPWALGYIGWELPALASGDLVFALLFIDWLRRTRPSEIESESAGQSQQRQRHDGQRTQQRMPHLGLSAHRDEVGNRGGGNAVERE